MAYEIINTNIHNHFQHPSTILICGPTQCGKTHFTIKALQTGLFQPKPSRIVWAYGISQPSVQHLKEALPSMELVRGIEELGKIDFSAKKYNLLVIDDLMVEGGKSDTLTDLFTRGSHHQNLTVLYLVQNLYHRGKSQRDCSLNSHYIVLFDNPRDRNQISILGQQMYPDHQGGRFLREALADACSLQSHGYLVLDLHTNTPDPLRIRTRIFPEDGGVVVYKPRPAVDKRKQTYSRPGLNNQSEYTANNNEDYQSEASQSEDEETGEQRTKPKRRFRF